MKSIEDLNKIKDEALKKVTLRQGNAKYRILVGMATCGIASGARPVMKTIMSMIEKDNLPCTIQMVGCIGMCIHEPIVEIINQSGIKTTYFEVNAKKAGEIIDSHIKNGTVLEAYTLTGAK
jgi:NADP-reducing hydrogenase subunit HndB